MIKTTRASALLLAAAAGIPTVGGAADLEAGKAKAGQVCAACHGANGVSVSDAIPNLAGQRVAYLETQLKAWKDGSRKNPIMNAIGGQLGADEITNLAAYFGSLPGANAAGAKSEFLPQLAKTSVPFPEGYAASFKRYHAINLPAARRVQVFYANPVAWQAAREGRPLPNGAYLLAETYAAKLDADKKPVAGPDGLYLPDQLLAYVAMARDAGWGQDIPEMLRNEDWNYAVFAPDKQRRTAVNQAECLACHKPMAAASYTFTLDKLKDAALAAKP